MSNLLTKADAARMLGVSQRTIDYWRSQGPLKAVELGPGPIRFRRSDLEVLVVSYQVQKKGIPTHV